MKDIKARFGCTIYKVLCTSIRVYHTILCRFKMMLWGIDYGRGCSFRGSTLFFRSPNSIIEIGDKCRFNSNTRFNFRGINHRCILQTIKGGHIRIGNNCGFSGVSIISGCKVSIGNNVLCGANVIIGDRNNHENIYGGFEPTPVTIEDNVWVGMNSVIMRGVTIGKNSIIGANSIVTKSIPANVIAVGSPCKVIKERKDNESVSINI